MGKCNFNQRPVKILKGGEALAEFFRETCTPTQLEIVRSRRTRTVLPLWRSRVWEWGTMLVFVSERNGRYEVHQVRSTVGIRLAA